MANFTKVFTTQIHKEIILTKNQYNDGYNVRMTFKISNNITLFEGECKTFQINYESGHSSIKDICFHAEIYPDQIRILVKGSCQIRSIVENDEIQKFVLEKLGTVDYQLGRVKIDYQLGRVNHE